MHETTEHALTVRRTARFFVMGDAAGPAREHWYVLHGQGQLARTFLGYFEALESAGRLVIAPEALSRYYTRNYSEAPGACWMTREDRLAEIRDYVGYLDDVRDRVEMLHGAPETRVVLGFSQGSATACRWASFGREAPDRLVAWAGDVPGDLPESALRNVPLALVYGTRDPLLTDERRKALMKRLDDLELSPTILTFDGGHRMDRATLLLLADGPNGQNVHSG